MTARYSGATRHPVAGFTLVELMIVVVIVSILAAIGYPSYLGYVVRANRQAARSALYQIADRQEQFFLDNKRYAAGLGELNFAGDSVGLDRDGQWSAPDAGDRIYLVTVADGDNLSYTLTATPQLVQAERDTDCGMLSLTHTGQRDQTGGSDNCW